MITICADTTNCYDRIAHLFASLCAQYFGLNLPYLVILFRVIQSIKMFLRIVFGVSENYYLDDDDDRPFEGIVQGSGAALALWMIISIFLVRYLYSKNLTIQLLIPLSGIVMPLAVLIFIDDTDLYIFNSESDTIEDLVFKVQQLLDAWHYILKFIGGDLKLLKCYWILQDY